MPEPLVLISRPRPGVLLLTLNRPRALNALSNPLFAELNAALAAAEDDDTVRAIVITGGEKVFAAGADIKDMKDLEFSQAYKRDFLASWTFLSTIRKPIISAVAGYALGGGTELALAADLIVCTPTAVFGLPELNLGVIPGFGGTQRLTHAIGKARAMDVVLNGRRISGVEAGEWGLASRVTQEGESVVDKAVEMAAGIAGMGDVAVMAGKEAVNAALELPLSQGLRLERRIFHGLFATPDMKEGMGAFVEKRKPRWPSRL